MMASMIVVPLVSYGEWPHFFGMLMIFLTLYALFGHIPDRMARSRRQRRRR